MGGADGVPALEGVVDKGDQFDHFCSPPGYGIVVVGGMPQLLRFDKCICNPAEFDDEIECGARGRRWFGVEVTVAVAPLPLRGGT